jgi:hypothetical protein
LGHDELPVDVMITGESMAVAGVCTGYVNLENAVRDGSISIDGNAQTLTHFFELFEVG